MLRMSIRAWVLSPVVTYALNDRVRQDTGTFRAARPTRPRKSPEAPV